MPKNKSKNPSKLLDIHKRMHASDDADELVRLEFEKLQARHNQNEENRKFASGVRKGRSFLSAEEEIPEE